MTVFWKIAHSLYKVGGGGGTDSACTHVRIFKLFDMRKRCFS